MVREIGHSIIRLPEVDSTNDELARRMRSGALAEHGTVLAAAFQTKGRGMGTNTWDSVSGMNLTFSFIIQPDYLDAARQFYVNVFVSLALNQFVSDLLPGEEVRIKWPNDICVGSKKIAGILISHTVTGREILYSVIGIGLNVNQNVFSHDLPNPVSLSQVSGIRYDTEGLLGDLLVYLNDSYRKVSSGMFENNMTAYKNSLLGFGKWRSYRGKKGTFKARIRDVSENGLLILEKVDGRTLECNFKEVEFIF